MPHQVEEYARTSGLRIDTMELFRSYYPLGFEEEYIVVVTGTGVAANAYPHFHLAINAVREQLKERNIKIVQVGGPEDERIGADIDLCGKTHLYQYFWLVEHASLLVSSDTSAIHIAGHFNVPLVAVFGISHPNISGAYFGDSAKKRYILPEYANGRASFSPNENPPVIHKTKPELVANAIAELLDFKLHKTTTFKIGSEYKLHALLVIPNIIVRPDFAPNNVLNLRLDKGGEENTVYAQLQQRRCQVFTTLPLDINKLKLLRPHVERVVYEVTKDNPVSFVKALQQEGIPYHLISNLSEDELNERKIEFFDLGVVQRFTKESRPEEVPDNLRFLTNRVILDGGKIYLSWAHRREGKSVDRLENNTDTIIDSEDFWEDQGFYYLYTNT